MQKIIIYILLCLASTNITFAENLILTDVIKSARKTTIVSEKDDKATKIQQYKDNSEEAQNNSSLTNENKTTEKQNK